MAQYPATKTIHWPTGPVDCCDRHAEGLVKIGNVMGVHVAVTEAAQGAECTNCMNEAPNTAAEGASHDG